MKLACKAIVPGLLAALLLAGCRPAEEPFECTDAIGCVEIAAGEPVQLGALQALTGDMGPQGQELLQVTQLALGDRENELLGHPVVLQIEDSQCTGEGGTTAALKVTADPQVVGIIGPSCSGAAASAMEIVADTGLVMVSGSSTAPSLTSVGGLRGSNWQPGFYRTGHNDAMTARLAASYAFEELGLTRAATINDGDPYTQGLSATFAQVFSELGGQVVLDAAVNKGDTNMRPVLSAVAESGAELLFFGVFRMEGDYIVLQASELEGMEDITLMTAEGLYFDAFIEAVGEAGQGMYFSTPAKQEGAVYDEFTARYRAEFGELPLLAPYAAHAYDAATLLLDAIERVAVQQEDGTLYISRQALRDALYATSDYEGLSGTLTCDEYGDCGAIGLQLTRLDDPSAGLDGLARNVVYRYPADQ
jgi:branched-chain amino acid transport system substrate-binding protein